MATRNERKDAFNEVPEIYDEVRPGYPEQLIEDVIALSGISPDGRILEIGCGTGQATLSFAKRGYSMLCLEIGKNLAALAAGNCQDYPNVEILAVAFEDWKVEPGAFDLVMSATAFHWIPVEIGYPKAAQALRDTGSIALFSNLHPNPFTGFFETVQEVYQRVVPEWGSPQEDGTHEDRIRAGEAQMNGTGLFDKMIVKRYPWSKDFNADQYIKLLDTYSGHRLLPVDKKRALYDGVRELIEQFGGTVTRPYVAVLFLARKAGV